MLDTLGKNSCTFPSLCLVVPWLTSERFLVMLVPHLCPVQLIQPLALKVMLHFFPVSSASSPMPHNKEKQAPLSPYSCLVPLLIQKNNCITFICKGITPRPGVLLFFYYYESLIFSVIASKDSIAFC